MSFEGIVLLDKKPGITSMASDNFIKKLALTRKVGHSGTLDPFATGLLPIFVGKALKVMRYTDDYDKAYDCIACFGVVTETLDSEGDVIGGRMPDASEIEAMISDDFKVIRDAFREVAGRETQIPPKYSAKKIDGRKAYELARSGKEVELKPNKIKIYDLTINRIWVEDSKVYADFSVSCSKGTYIRTICGDVGELTGFGAHAVALRRTKCGPFTLDMAKTEEELKSLTEANDYSFVLNSDEAVSYMDKVNLNDKDYKDVRLGRKIKAIDGTSENIKYAAYYEGKLAAVLYRVREDGRDIMRIERMLAVD